ncbi:MAG: chemotaxis protein CheW [Candidatus Nanopelagicales bacterium]
MSRAPVFADGLDEIAQEFLVESYENLDELDRALVALEKEPGSRPLLASIFRTIHTIKGTSGFLAFNRLEAVTHVGENVLSKLRDGKLDLTPEIATCLLQMVDTVRELLGAIERTGGEGDIDTAAVEAALARCLEAPAEQAESAPEVPEPAAAPVLEAAAPVVAEPHLPPQTTPATESTVPDTAPEAACEDTLHDGEFPVIDPFLDQPGDDAPDAVVDSLPETLGDAGGEESRRSVADSSIRVDVGLLDQLMRMVGELVLTRNQVVRHVGDLQHVELQRASQRLNLLATELQEGVMKTRMQPIGQIWGRLPRVVRDLGAQCGKSVQLVMEGKETELDRTLLEAVKDPLTHLVRNAIDHGLETPEERVAAGKPAEGTLLLRSYHEGGQVVVEVTDDGGGIDAAKVTAKALEHGLVNRDQVARMSEREIHDLIFMPGFSTASEVTNVSGRGVGMDVVRTNIEKIGGSVDLVSKFGEGTTVRVRIPLTLAIIPALVVGQGGDSYAIPQANLLELVRLESDGAGPGVEYVGGAPVYRLRGTLLPLVFLAEQLRLQRDERPSAYNIVVLSSDHAQFGLVVEDIQDTQEIVVQPLSRQVKHVDVFAGATITGDGKVSLILDVSGLAQRATADPAQVSSQRAATHDAAAGAGRETTQLVICQVGDDRRLALPMTDVARLEEIPVSDVERAGSTEVVQYRGDLLRLVHVGDLLGMHGSAERSDTYSVVVHRDDDETAVGLVVDRILDVVEEEIRLSEVGLKHGLRGSAELQSRVTDIVDVPALVAAARGGF